MRKGDGCSIYWECRFVAVLGSLNLNWRNKHGKNEYADSRDATEVQSAGAQPLQALRPPAGIYAAVPVVPYLLPGIGAAGRDPRCGKIKLVTHENE